MAARRNKAMMVRSCRVYLNDLNPGKALLLRAFLYQCHAILQFFIDLFWQRQDFSGTLADLPTVHRGVHRFGITTRLAQALAKQAKEILRSQRKKKQKRKPRLRRHTVDVPGLATEADTVEKLIAKLKIMIPELLEANGCPLEAEVPFRLEAARTERASVV